MMNKKYKFHELVSKVTIDPHSESLVVQDILSWVKDDVKQIIVKESKRRITSKKKQRV